MLLSACQKPLWNKEESSGILADFQSEQLTTDVSKAQLKNNDSGSPKSFEGISSYRFIDKTV